MHVIYNWLIALVTSASSDDASHVIVSPHLHSKCLCEPNTKCKFQRPFSYKEVRNRRPTLRFSILRHSALDIAKQNYTLMARTIARGMHGKFIVR
jgi:hypothetical protein